MNIQAGLEPNLGGGRAALPINTSSAFILCTGRGWKHQNAQGKTFLRPLQLAQMHRAGGTHQKCSLRLISSPVLQIPVAEPALRERPGHIRCSAHTKREWGQTDGPCVSEGYTEAKTSSRPHASSSANSPIHPWAGDSGRHTAEGTLLVPPLQMMWGCGTGLGLLQPSSALGTPQDPPPTTLITPPFRGLQCKCLNLRQSSKTSVNGEK